MGVFTEVDNTQAIHRSGAVPCLTTARLTRSAAGWTGGYCVTLYVGGLHFIRPIRVGDLVELRALVIHTGRTSLHIAIDTYARDPKLPGLKRTGHCVIVFVSLNEAGRPQPVPTWTPVSDTDRALQAYALRLIELRKLMDTELESHLAQLEQSTAAISV